MRLQQTNILDSSATLNTSSMPWLVIAALHFFFGI